MTEGGRVQQESAAAAQSPPHLQEAAAGSHTRSRLVVHALSVRTLEETGALSFIVFPDQHQEKQNKLLKKSGGAEDVAHWQKECVN